MPGATELTTVPSLGLRRVKLPPGVSVPDAVRRYSALRWVRAAEPNYIVRGEIVPNDPLYGSQSWYFNLLKAPTAWDIQTGDASVTIAVVDSGIDRQHPDLNDNLWANPAEPVNGLDDDGNTVVDDVYGAAFVSSPSPGCSSPPASNPDDDSGHGTLVSGVLGAETNTSPARGVAGTAWDVSLIAVKALDCTAVGTIADAAKAIAYAAPLAPVLNLSFSITIPRDNGGNCLTPGVPVSLRTAVQQAKQTYGTIFVAAAGNDNCPFVAYPAAFPEVIAVAASGGASSPGARAPFSNWGPEIALAAPGRDLCSTGWTAPTGAIYACALEGTSFASPLVAGLIALMRSEDPTLTDEQIRGILAITATNLPDGSWPNWDGVGRINMRAAVETVTARSFFPGTSRD